MAKEARWNPWTTEKNPADVKTGQLTWESAAHCESTLPFASRLYIYRGRCLRGRRQLPVERPGRFVGAEGTKRALPESESSDRQRQTKANTATTATGSKSETPPGYCTVGCRVRSRVRESRCSVRYRKCRRVVGDIAVYVGCIVVDVVAQRREADFGFVSCCRELTCVS